MANVFEMVFRAVDKATAPIRKINKATKGLRSGLAGIGKIAVKGLAVGAFAGLISLSTLLGVSVQKAIAFESAMADVKKVVGDGFKSPDEFKQFSDDILAMSRNIPVAADGLAEIAAEAAASGIALEDNLRFTEFAAKSAVAFDTTAGEIGESFAKIRNVYQLNQDGLENMSNAVNHLSNNMAAKAPQIIDFINRAGGAAPLLGASAEQMAALGSSLIAVGVAPENAARGINALATRLEVGGKRITGAFKDIGLNYDQFKKGLKSDPAGSLEKLFAAIDKSPKGTAALKELVGQDFVDDFLKLSKRTDLLAGSFELLTDKTAMAGSVQAEYEARAATTANNIQLMKNNMDALAVTVGSALLPPLNEALQFINQFLSGLGDGSSVLEQALASVGTFWVDFSKSFAGSFDGISEKFRAVGTAFSELAETISSMFSKLTGDSETFGTTMGSAMGSAVEIALGVIEVLIQGITVAVATIGPVIMKIVEFVRTVSTRIGEQFGSLQESFHGVFTAFDRLGEALGKVFSALLGDGEGFANLIGDVIVVSLEALAVILETVVNSLAYLLEKFAEFVEFVKTGFADLDWSALKPDFSDWEFPSFSLFGDDAEDAAEKVNRAVDSVKPKTSAFDVSDPAAIKKAVQMVREIEKAQKAIEQQSASVLAAVNHMVTTANATLQSVDWTVHGARMMDTLAAGMRARAHVVVDQIRATMQEVRNHLPSSPAKVGPLSDIDRLKFGETIARSIKPDAMVKAMRVATAAVRVAANDNGFSALARAELNGVKNNGAKEAVQSETRRQTTRRAASPASGVEASGGSRGDIHINIPGGVTLGGKDGMTQAEFEGMLEQAARKVKAIIDGEDKRLNRRKFA